MDFVFHAAGHKKPKVQTKDFGTLFEPEALKARFGVDSHESIEAAHDAKTGQVYVNSKAKAADGRPLSIRDRDAAAQHENVHFQINKLASLHPNPEVAKLGLNAHFINILGMDKAKQIARYIDATRGAAGHHALSNVELANEVIPYLASISTKGSAHRASFMKHNGLDEAGMQPFDEGWAKVVAAAKDFGPQKIKPKTNLQSAVDNSSPTADKQTAAAEDLPSTPLKRSVSMAVALGLQPSPEQWEAAVGQQLGIPADDEAADKLAKQAEIEWRDAIANSFKRIQRPVEKNSSSDWGRRGPVDQSDESQLTEEERRIRAIPVSPEVLKD